MISNIIHLFDNKNKKKYTKIQEDITNILKVLNTSQKALSFYKHYIPCQEIISVIATNTTIFELHLKKCEEELKLLTKPKQV